MPNTASPNTYTTRSIRHCERKPSCATPSIVSGIDGSGGGVGNVSAVAVGVTVGVHVCVAVGVMLGVAVRVAVRVAVGVLLGVGVALGVSVRVGVGVWR